MPILIYACSQCDRALDNSEEYCPDHPDASILTIIHRDPETIEGPDLRRTYREWMRQNDDR